MAKGAPEPQQSGQDTSLDFLWVIAMIMAAIFLIWYFGRVYITNFLFHVRYGEIFLINIFLNTWNSFASLVGLPQTAHTLGDWANFIKSNYGNEVDFSVITSLSSDVGDYLRYPVAAVLFGLAALLYFGGAHYRFRHTFDTKTLKLQEQENWPQIVPVVKLDLVAQKIDEGPWAISLSPMRFCKQNNLLDIEEKGGRYTANLRHGVAYRILSLQLGPRWRGVEALPIYLKALMAIFAARMDNDRKSAENLLDYINKSAAAGKLHFGNYQELLRKHVGAKKVAKIINLHGYVTTVFASLLVGAREVGVVATSEFIWLKPLDRRMWYMLNSVGRPTAVAEICGAFAHWIAEKKMGLPLMVPMVEEGVKGLELAMKDIIYKPEEKD